ncbi:MAG TPA: helix-turn-helix transcriptional regulator [Ktedonobacteraceae bacterium]|jgi:transcriptional regulator with XRE-family HTH domain
MSTIKDLREAKGWSQTKLAQRAMLSHPIVNKSERGKPISEKSFLLICNALGVKPEKVSGVVLTTGKRQDKD